MKKVKGIIRFIVIIACAVYLIRFFYLNRDTVKIVFTLDSKLLAAIVVLQPIFYLLQSWRFRIIMEKCSNATLPFWPWLKIFIQMRFLNTIFSQAGNVYCSVTLKNRYGISYTKYIGGHASVTWLDTSMNLIMALGVVLLFKPDFRIGQFIAWKLIAIAAMSIIALPILAEMLLGKMTFSNKSLCWIHQRLHQVIKITVKNLNDPAYLLKIFLIGILLFIRTCIVFYICFLCFDIKTDLATLAVFYAIFKLSIFITITPGNIGVREVVWGVLSESMGIGMTQGVLVSALMRVIGTTSILILGISCGGFDLIRGRKKYTQIEETDETL